MSTPHIETSPLHGLLEEVVEVGGSDLHLTAGAPPLVRIDGDLCALEHPSMSPEEVADVILGLLDEPLRDRLAERRALDFSFNWYDTARFRANVFFQRGSMALAIRRITYAIPTFEDLRLPVVCDDLVRLHQGLILVTGPTGSGKSTTLASLIGWINKHRPVHVLTIEDPIEYVHRHGMGIVNQREIGEDAPSFPEALRSALREDPDVVMIGEMRDTDTIQAALTIAETGHLVFATLHTNDTGQTIDRIVDVFPGAQQTQIRVQLANSLKAVLYQRLLPRIGGGRVAAFEVLVANTPVRNLILEGRTRQLRNQVTTGQREGMQTMEMALNTLILEGLVDRYEAIARSLYPREIVSLAPADAPSAGTGH